MHISLISRKAISAVSALVFLAQIQALSAQPMADALLGVESAGQTLGVSDYLLRPSDILQVKVFQEDDLTREVSISRNYEISLPLIGLVNVKNRTVGQVEELIRQLYDRDYLVNPQVSLIVLKYAERAVNVMGAVNSPSAVAFPPEKGLTLMEAITRAGGFNRFADKTKVKVRRTDDKGVTSEVVINANKSSSNLFTLQVDDVIDVPENIF